MHEAPEVLAVPGRQDPPRQLREDGASQLVECEGKTSNAETEDGPGPADLNGDGFVGFQDMLSVLNAWGPCAACPEDMDGDGVVGFQDLLRVLDGWD